MPAEGGWKMFFIKHFFIEKYYFSPSLSEAYNKCINIYKYDIKVWIYLKVINPDQVPLTEPYFNLQQVTCKQTNQKEL